MSVGALMASSPISFRCLSDMSPELTEEVGWVCSIAVHVGGEKIMVIVGAILSLDPIYFFLSMGSCWSLGMGCIVSLE